MGQLAGDALGSMVEFRTASQIAAAYPTGLRHMTGSPIWGTLPGQPTDDSEMALALARMLVRRESYEPEKAFKLYKSWLDSRPFDKGNTIESALMGQLDPTSQANGAMMRISPLGIFGAGRDEDALALWAEQDATLTHPNEVCREANILFALAIAEAIALGINADEVYTRLLDRAVARRGPAPLLQTIKRAAERPPDEYFQQMGWVLIALGNALWQLLHAPSLEEAIVDTVARGGDTDTNAAICGALMGAVHGIDAIPAQWRDCVLSCRPETGLPGVRHPRPDLFWPVDALELADGLLAAGR